MPTEAQIRGVVPVMVTPMNQDHSIDADGVHRLVDHLYSHGAGGLWVLGSAGEDVALDETQRLDLVRQTAKAASGKLPIIAGAGLLPVDGILRFLDRVGDVEIGGLHILYHDPKIGDGRLISELERLADASHIPVWLYHNPKRGRPLSLHVIQELKQHPNIVGMKVGGYDLSMMVNCLALQDESFTTIGAGGSQMLAMFALGSTAHTASSACCWIEGYVSLFNAFQSGDLDLARRIQFSLVGLEKGLPRTDNGEYAAEEKYVLTRLGIGQEYVNSSYRLLTTSEKAQADAVLERYRSRES